MLVEEPMGCTLLDKRIIHLNIVAKTSEEALDALSIKMYKAGYVKDSYMEAIKVREREFATGLPANGMGIAIPHTDIIHVNQPAVGIGILQNSVKFQMMGAHETDIEVEILFMLALNKAHSQIEMLQKLMALIQDDIVLRAMKQCQTTQEVLKLLEDKI
jgi:PTS system galactitol-specific IIA component